MTKRVALLWQASSLGLYSNSTFEELYKGVGHNNGNLAFVYAIANQLDAEINYFPWHASAKALAEMDVIVIPCANQLGKHTDLGGLAEILTKADKPIVAIGLGAQAADMETEVTLTEGTSAWVRTLDSHRPASTTNIYTRGPFTSDLLKKLGIESVVGGCPSHFINPRPDLGAAVEKSWAATPIPRSISVAGGHQSWKQVRTIEQQLVAMMQDPACIGQYVVQSMGDMIRISRDELDQIEPDKLLAIRNHIAPHYTVEEFRGWCRNYARSFYDIPSWMDSLRRFDLTIGPRFHGTQIAIQGGKMGVCVTIDSRTEEMCRQTGVPFLKAKDIENLALTRASLAKMIKFSGAAYDAQRSERARNYIAFLEANGLTPKRHLFNIAEAEVDAVAA